MRCAFASLSVTLPCSWFCLQVRLANRFQSRDRPISILDDVTLIVDSAEFQIQRPSDPYTQELFFSGKSKRHSLKYMFACAIDGRLCYVSSPAFGCTSDLMQLYHSQVLEKLHPLEFVLGDKGYQGHPKVIVPFKSSGRAPLSDERKQFNKAIGAQRVVIERVIGRLRQFSCMKQVWRHELAKHPSVMFVISNLVHQEIILHPL
jgi:hypothetical protein